MPTKTYEHRFEIDELVYYNGKILSVDSYDFGQLKDSYFVTYELFDLNRPKDYDGKDPAFYEKVKQDEILSLEEFHTKRGAGELL